VVGHSSRSQVGWVFLLLVDFCGIWLEQKTVSEA